jgi:signal transduction histidine kinase
MTERWRILLLSIGIMVAVSLSAAALGIYVLYKASFQVHRARLSEVVQSRARLIEAVARFDARYSRDDVPGGAEAATLSQMIDAHEKFNGFGETGEFTLARRDGDQIVWLLTHRHEGLELPDPTPFHSEMAEPMRRALAGECGTLVGVDYRGVEVLAAYEAIPETGWGVVAKIDIREIHQPFARAAMLAGGIAFFLVVVGVAFILRVTSPLIGRVEARGEELRKAHERLRAAASEAALAEERERRKLAIDLHDGIGQLLALANMKLGMLRGSAGAHGLEPQVREVEQLIVQANERSGSLTFQLCPPVLYDVGLLKASQWLARDLEHRYGMKVTLEDDGDHQPLDEATRISLFRSLREALINVAKHAGTSKAKVRFSKRDRSLAIAVEDSGVGFSPGKDNLGYGLFSISERMNHLGGSVEIESAPGQGTRVVLIAPITSKRPEEDMEST